ncbi:fungal-specific transcription factor domain-containing protein [Mariannaea sp. PMI_226]|nr:fungal-specific transcription factor domain-containing protein [Mariannaea sp. PMI_226]
MPSSGCGTCRDRRIRCDRTFPICVRCIRSLRICQGYGLRLSWPQGRDKRRAIEGPEPPASMSTRRIKPNTWLHTSFLDINKLYMDSSNPSYFQDWSIHVPLPAPTAAIRWNPSQVDDTASDLLHYFESIAVHTLSTCDDNPYKFLGALTRLAFSNAAESSNAVLHAIFAVASVHRHGPRAESVRLQGSAIHALKSSAQKGLDDTETIQHVAASMLLCSFEVQANSQTPGPWLWYVNGAKRLIQAINPRKRTLPVEFLAMVNWVYYHDVMAQFSLRHWRLGQKAAEWDFAHPLGPTLSTISRRLHIELQIAGLGSCSLTVLEPLSEVFKSLVASSNPRYHSETYRKHLKTLEVTLDDIVTKSSLLLKLSQDRLPIPEVNNLLSLFRLAALVYLERVSNNISELSTKVNAWINSAFNIIENIRACKHLFPLLIFGCEARTDAHRVVILDAIDETSRKTHSLNLQLLRGLLQSVWIQDDLQNTSEMNYNERLSAILSSSKTIPSFA